MTADVIAALAPWHDFFVATAGASAVLLGLVFIGLTIHLDGRKADVSLVPIAVASATTLFYPVVLSLVLLVPAAQPWLPSAGLFVVAVFAVLSAGSPIFDKDLRALWLPRRRWQDLVRYGMPWLLGFGLLIASVLFLIEPVLASYIVGFTAICFLAAGTQNAWNLLLAGRWDVSAWGVTRANDKKDAPK